MFVQRREAAQAGAAGVAGDTFTAVQHLHQGVGDARLELQSHQRVRHAVAVAFDLDVVVDVHRHGLERCPLPALCWQGRQRRRVQAAQHWLDAYNAERPPAERLLPAALLLKAAARALQQALQFNGFYENGGFRAGTGIHIGWAISLRGGGLVAPAIHDADRLSLPSLMTALRDLVQRTRAGGLRSSELTDPTITVTSLGERGADTVWGVIYPPQVAIVGFGRIAEQPWVVDGQVGARPLVALSLAADHRASDGHLGGQLLAVIDQAMQNPDKL